MLNKLMTGTGTTRTGSSGTGDGRSSDQDVNQTVRALIAFTTVGALLLLLYALGVSGGDPKGFLGFNFPSVLMVVGVGGLIAAASAAVGGMLGFLFGIPKSLAQGNDPSTEEAGNGASQSNRPTSRAAQSPNTNLERISDWLTTIFVGVGLTQIGEIPGLLREVATKLTVDLVAQVPSAPTMAMAIISYFAITGFLAGYLLTRLFLSGAFSRADQNANQLPDEKTLKALEQAVGEDRLAVLGDKLDTEVQHAALQLQSVSLEQLTQPEAIVAWARANRAFGRFDDAERGYRRALELDGTQHGIKREYANLLALMGHTGQADDLLEKIRDDADESRKYQIALDQIMNHLYEKPPWGFQRAINKANNWIERIPREDTRAEGKLWFMLASAYGQEYAWTREQDPEAEELAEIRDRCLESVRKSLSITPAWKRNLQMIWDKHFPNKPADENELEPFYEDAEFRALLTDS